MAATVENLVKYAQGRTNLQSDPFWSAQPAENKKKAFNIIMQQNRAKGLTAISGQVPKTSQTGQATTGTAGVTGQTTGTAPVGKPPVPPTGQIQTTQISGFNMAAISSALQTIDPNSDRLKETIANLGYTPVSPDEQLLAIRATYTPEELKSLGLDQPFQQLEQQRGQAQADLLATPQPTNTSLRVLQDALNAKVNVTNQTLGESGLFKQAGLSGYDVLSQNLAQRSQEMQQTYNSFAVKVSDVSGTMVDTYNLALNKYNVLNEDYQRQLDRFQEVQDDVATTQKQLMFMQKEADLQKERDAAAYADDTNRWTWNDDLKAFTNPYGDIRYVDTSDSSGQWIDGQAQVLASSDPNSENYYANAANCVKFARELVPNLPYGLWDKESKQKAVDPTITTPSRGMAVLTSEGDYGHVAIISGFDDEGNMILTEANYKAGVVTTGRKLTVGDEKIYGYIGGTSPGGYTYETADAISRQMAQEKEQKTPEGLNPWGAETYNGQNVFNSEDYGDLDFKFESAVLGLQSVTEQEKAQSIYEKYKSKGDFKTANNYIRAIAYDGLSAGQKADLLLVSGASSQAASALSLIDSLPDADIDYYKNIIENNKKWFNLKKDQEWVQIKQNIEASQAELRKYLFGTAVTNTEAATAANLLVTDNDDLESIKTKLEGYKTFTKSVQERMINERMGIFEDPDTGEQIQTEADILSLDI